MLPPTPTSRRALAASLLLSACAPRVIPAGPVTGEPGIADAPDRLVMSDGARLPLRSWLPDGPVGTVLLCLHGFNDSRNFMVEPAPALNAAGVAVYAYDQRGFGGAPNRGIWPGAATLAADASAVARLLAARHPGAPLFLLGESMGGAVVLVAAASDDPPPVAGSILLAPAVWGRVTMPRFVVGLLDALAHTIPIVATEPGNAFAITPTDNEAALRRLSRDPLTIRETRVDAAYGLVGLMDDALAVAPRLPAAMPPMLLVYGGRDQLVPPVATRLLLSRLSDAAPCRVAYYPRSYHLALRDSSAPIVIADLLAWMRAPAAPLPSGADRAAVEWRAQPPRGGER
ncbi:alpha/beta fold hydrolase [Roseomonas sp. CCTCC AB2023176]|uniref:alpha/beta fold hydrolase n=1 Tax=Roseomonas sp. CCTCC AB2023176 TaxID=3342640 RepID=UPI0035E0D368